MNHINQFDDKLSDKLSKHPAEFLPWCVSNPGLCPRHLLIVNVGISLAIPRIVLFFSSKKPRKKWRTK